ncbi:DUF2147 domain-containing protein [Hymenobacter sp. 5516J-16]|uniref:DUF2147 domain-containing protein n=2 Tax=Hymenobacter TaxID=89966 RepID=A0ABY4JDB7_9BACT|nr:MULTISPECIES: DUF2147 domain-containing protein [Hymenobacter]UOQ77107.1 DUF2147 domain-containing protein [Hymenobacter sp. 5516J-16]UPL50795.1 DUF2147 domain-containing protein [Hymenobacter sublimis]GGG51548.1 hypothetical protein GCM10011378_29710 [Hymenobacter glacieicola]
MKKILFLCLGMFLGLLGAASAQSLSPLGVWTNAEKKATFEIYKCGDKLCGKIVSLTVPNDPKTGKPKTDTMNPEPKLRNRPRLGMVFMQGFEYDDDNKWDDGKIYDPESGKTYSCYMKMLNANSMEVKGYIGFSMIGKSQTWTRVK